MSRKVIIAGGSGLIGSQVAELLSLNGYEIFILSRQSQKRGQFPVLYWDPYSRKIDPQALTGSPHIINFSGTGIADKRWTPSRKKEILESRTLPVQFLYELIRNNPGSVRSFISASAIGIYGYDTGSIVLKEDRKKFGDDFLATVVKEWEENISAFHRLGIRTVIFRIGIVLSKKGGALPKLADPVKYGLGSSLGNGEQYLSWIHIRDLSRLFLYAVGNNISGTFNAVAPNPVTNRVMMREIGAVLNKKIWLPPVPAILLKLVLGEMASMVTGGNLVSADKILESGFQFEYEHLQGALKNILLKV